MVFKLLGQFSFAINQILKGNLKSILKGFCRKIYSESILLGLKLDLTKDLKKPISFTKINIRLYKEEDSNFFKEDNENIYLLKKIPKCYVAITENGEPCFKQWIIDASQNQKMRKFWGESYPQLNDNEALMESAYTISKFRGRGIMPLAIYKIALLAQSEEIKTIYTFAPKSNANSLRALHYSGFKPYCIQKERFFLFKKSVIFQDLNDEMSEYFELITRKRRKKNK